jgi:hypothetical protein
MKGYLKFKRLFFLKKIIFQYSFSIFVLILSQLIFAPGSKIRC